MLPLAIDIDSNPKPLGLESTTLTIRPRKHTTIIYNIRFDYNNKAKYSARDTDIGTGADAYADTSDAADNSTIAYTRIYNLIIIACPI